MELFQKLGIDWRLILIQIVNFGVLLLILRKFLYKPVLNMLERRRKEVEDSLALSEQVKQEFKELEEQKKSELAKAQSEAQLLLFKAQEYAAKTMTRGETEAKQRSEEMMERARKVINEEKEKIVKDVKAQAVEIVIGAAQAVIGKELKGKEAEEFINKHLKAEK